LVARIKFGCSKLGVAFEIEATSLHEAKRFRNTVGQLDIAPRLRTILHKAEHPLPHAREIGIATLREGAQQVERCRRLPKRFDLPTWIGTTRLFGKGDVVNDITSIARQFFAITFLGWRRT